MTDTIDEQIEETQTPQDEENTLSQTQQADYDYQQLVNDYQTQTASKSSTQLTLSEIFTVPQCSLLAQAKAHYQGQYGDGLFWTDQDSLSGGLMLGTFPVPGSSYWSAGTAPYLQYVAQNSPASFSTNRYVKYSGAYINHRFQGTIPYRVSNPQFVEYTKATSIPDFSSKKYVTGSIIEGSFSQVVTVGRSAFFNDEFLSRMYLPECTTIRTAAFRNATALSYFYAPKLTRIWPHALRNTAIHKLASTVQYIGNYGCETTSIEQAILPSLSSLGNYAFRNCVQLTQASFPMVSIIESSVFWGCSKLQYLSLENCTKIKGTAAFQYCLALKQFSAPHLVYIKDAANQFVGLNFLTTSYESGQQTTLQTWYTPELGQSTTEIASMFYMQRYLKDVTYGGTFSKKYSTITASSSYTKQISRFFLPTVRWNIYTQIDECYAFFSYYSPTWAIPSYEQLSTIQQQIHDSTFGVSLTLPQCISTAGLLFTPRKYKVTFVKGKKYKISDDPVSYASSCTFMTYPTITHLNIPNLSGSMIQITNLKALKTLSLPKISQVCSDMATSCSYLQEVNIDSIQTINNNAFSDCTNLSKITGKPQYIGMSAFYHCYNLSDINLYYASIKTNAFFYAGLQTVQFNCDYSGSQYSYHINSNAFYNCANLIQLGLGWNFINPTYNSINTYAFSWCSHINTVFFPQAQSTYTEEEISSAFSSWGIGYASSALRYYGQDGRIYNPISMSLSKFQFLSHWMPYTSIADYGLSQCIGLQQLNLPQTRLSLSQYAFSGCPSLSAIFYSGTLEDWEYYTSSIYKPSNLYLICNSTAYQYVLNENSQPQYTVIEQNTETKFTMPITERHILGNSNYPMYKITADGKLFIWRDNLDDSDPLHYTVPSNAGGIANNWMIKTIIIEDGIKVIQSHAFHDDKNIQLVIVPASITTWGENVFEGCEKLKSVGPYEDDLTLPDMDYEQPLTFYQDSDNTQSEDEQQLNQHDDADTQSDSEETSNTYNIVYYYEDEIPSYAFSGAPYTNFVVNSEIHTLNPYSFTSPYLLSLDLSNNIGQLDEDTSDSDLSEQEETKVLSSQNSGITILPQNCIQADALQVLKLPITLQYLHQDALLEAWELQEVEIADLDALMSITIITGDDNTPLDLDMTWNEFYWKRHTASDSYEDLYYIRGPLFNNKNNTRLQLADEEATDIELTPAKNTNYPFSNEMISPILMGCASLTSITIRCMDDNNELLFNPNGNHMISAGAFAGCDNLKTVKFQALINEAFYVTDLCYHIGCNAFSFDPSLTTVQLPVTLDEVSTSMFENSKSGLKIIMYQREYYATQYQGGAIEYYDYSSYNPDKFTITNKTFLADQEPSKVKILVPEYDDTNYPLWYSKTSTSDGGAYKRWNAVFTTPTFTSVEGIKDTSSKNYHYWLTFNPTNYTYKLWIRGHMSSYATIESAPWGDYCQRITSIDCGKYLKHFDYNTIIPPYAFEGYTNLLSVTLRRTVTSVGYGAFFEDSKINYIYSQMKTLNLSMLPDQYNNEIQIDMGTDKQKYLPTIIWNDPSNLTTSINISDDKLKELSESGLIGDEFQFVIKSQHYTNVQYDPSNSSSIGTIVAKKYNLIYPYNNANYQNYFVSSWSSMTIEGFSGFAWYIEIPVGDVFE